MVELRGRAYTSAWIGKDGEPHAGLNFHTSQIKVHGTGKRTENKSTEPKKNDKKEISISRSKDSDKEDDLPF